MEPPAPQPLPALECPQCQAPFLPHSVDPNAWTTCPQCHANFQIHQTRLAAAPQLEIHPWRTQEADQQDAQEVHDARQSRFFVKSAIIIALMGAGLIWHFGFRSRPVQSLVEASSASPQQAEIKEVYAAAKTALESPDWQGLAQQVLDRERVQPLMEWYYAQKDGGYLQRTIDGYDQGAVDLTGTPPVATLRLSSAAAALHVLMQKTPAGWKLDWESFSNVHGTRWQYFITKHPSLPDTIEAPVQVERLSPNLLVPSFFTASGFNPADAGRAVRVFHVSAESSGVACFAPDSTVGNTLLQALPTLGISQKYTLLVRRLPANSIPQAIVIEKILHEGWSHAAAPQK